MGGSVRPKNLNICMKLNWNFQRGGGGGVLEKIPSVGEVWIFSGITQCTITQFQFFIIYEQNGFLQNASNGPQANTYSTIQAVTDLLPV